MKIQLNKHIILAALLCLLPFASMAQGVFTRFEHRDRFNDIITSETVKTLITKTDSTFVFETKGKDPVVYSTVLVQEKGSREEPANLVADIYGIEQTYMAYPNEFTSRDAMVLEAMVDSLGIDVNKNDYDSLNKEQQRALVDVVMKSRMCFITWRTASKNRYIFEYKGEIIWIEFSDGSRYIYSKY